VPQRYACPGATNGRQGKKVNGGSDFVSKDIGRKKISYLLRTIFIFTFQLRKGR
jgi:hypothetical protein